jgi:PST family polysaccharide transporter
MLALWFYSSWKPSLSFFKDLLYRLFSKSLWSSLQQIAIWIPIAFDTYLLSNYISSSALGFYSTARSLFQSVSLLIMGPILTVVFSSFSKIDDDQMFRKSVLFAQKILFSISVFIALFVFLYSNVIVGIVFSDEWEGITPVLSIIFILMGFETFYSIIIESLRARGFFKELALNNLISVLFSIPLVYVSAKEGLVTYTIVRCSSLYLCYFGVFHYSNKYLNISFWDCIKNSKYAIASIIMIFALAYIISIATCHYYILVTALFLTVISLFFFKEKKDILYLVRLFLHKNG